MLFQVKKNAINNEQLNFAKIKCMEHTEILICHYLLILKLFQICMSCWAQMTTKQFETKQLTVAIEFHNME